MGFSDYIRSFIISDADLSQKQLKRFSEHRHAVVNNSLIEPYLIVFWDKVVEKIPFWVAPNLITFVGLMLNFGSVLILLYYNLKDLPRWTYFLCAFTIFLYQTLDGVDGKQARRTNSSSPLGELFDHGCDAFSQVLVTVQGCAAMRLIAYPNFFLFVVLLGEIWFYCSHWQSYVSGRTMFNSFDSPEALTCAILFCLVSGFLGDEVWLNDLVPGVPSNILVILTATVMGFFGILQYMDIVFSEGAGKNGSSVANTSILSPITPMALVVIPQLMIYTHSTASNIFSDEMPLFCFTFGMISTKITIKLIIAYLTRSPVTVWDTIFCGPILIFLNQYYGEILPTYTSLIICLTYCSLSLFLFCYETVRQISVYLKISVFTISNQQHQHNQHESQILTNVQNQHQPLQQQRMGSGLKKII